MMLFYWILVNVFLLVITLVLVPLERIKQLFVYGFIGGTVLAVIIFFVADILDLWETVGSIEVFNVPILPTIAWFFPVVVFANFFPKSDLLISKILYILLFAVGSVVVQYTFTVLGMWINIKWSLFYTFLLAIGTHTFLSLYLMSTEQYLHEE